MTNMDRPFGAAGGRPTLLHTIELNDGTRLAVTDLGATIVELHVPDRRGDLADVVLGCDSAPAYLAQRAYFGAVVGRVANRIADARFELEGQRYELYPSDPPHHLHGGEFGWDRMIWKYQPLELGSGRGMRFDYDSGDGEEGYPGRVRATVRYVLRSGPTLSVHFSAVSNRPTLLNLAQHSYWNLAGHASGSVLEHELELQAHAYTPGNPVPRGETALVAGTAFDFLESKPVGRDIARVPGGFDHNFVVSGVSGALRPVALLRDPKSGRSLSLLADQPGVQLYTGNFLNGSIRGKGGVSYPQHAGLCLETQCFPNAINVPAWREQVSFGPTRPYTHTMVLRFATN